MQKWIKHITLWVFSLLFIACLANDSEEDIRVLSISGMVTEGESNLPLSGVAVFLSGKTLKCSKTGVSNKHGKYKFSNLKSGVYYIRFSMFGYEDIIEEVEVKEESVYLNKAMSLWEEELEVIEVKRKKQSISEEKVDIGEIENTQITIGKADGVDPGKTGGSQALNPARQTFATVTGINVWESDGAGLQIGIGGRGLSPNRTANFNTRQSGYDMSADALGYPESYYSPPMEAVEKIQIIRGAASIQYGPQFGGMVNFIMKEGAKDKTIEVNNRTTLGSYGLVNSFTSIGGTVPQNKLKTKKLNYYAFYQHKYGDGWRMNSQFNVNTGFAHLRYYEENKWSISLDYTIMDYLAQQAGGLTDAQFATDPRSSNRDRNWFRVKWNLAAATVDLNLDSSTIVNWRTFGLHASRQALGNLGKINRPDSDEPRDLIIGQFRNWGSEARLLHKFKWLGSDQQAFLFGARVYEGHTHSTQGYADGTADPNFEYLDPTDPGKSVFDFPSFNTSIFTSNMFRIDEHLSIIPGARYEYINTASDGYYNRVETHPLTGAILNESIIPEDRDESRSLLLYGLGAIYRFYENDSTGFDSKWYMNFTRNFKSITFSDMQIVNPNFEIDKDLKDETGYNFEVGTKGDFWDLIGYDVSAFYLYYHNRIGNVFVRDSLGPRIYRTNIADSRNMGIESYFEFDILKSLHRNIDLDSARFKAFNLFCNISYIDAKYVNSEEPAYQGNSVEDVPLWNRKVGVTMQYQKLKFKFLFTSLSEQFTDATNERQASADAIYGIIPSYEVMDLSTTYQLRDHITLEGGINNLTNNMYFTRRASGYPGPGIIPSDGRTFFITLDLKF